MEKIVINKCLIHTADELGECPVWDDIYQKLYWIDIEKGLIHQYTPSNSMIKTFSIGRKVGCIAPCTDGKFLLALEKAFSFWDPQKDLDEEFLHAISVKDSIMFNDGKIDPHGNFWVGTKGPEGKSHLFELSQQLSLKIIISGLSISNGLDWTLDGKYFYLTDSYIHTIFRYEYDLESNQISNPVVFYETQDGTPDGLALDIFGNLWVAIWDGYRVEQISPSGEILLHISLPVSRPTSISFGGSDLRTLFITSASTGLTAEELKFQPLAGDLFSLRVANPGRLPSRFHPQSS